MREEKLIRAMRARAQKLRTLADRLDNDAMALEHGPETNGLEILGGREITERLEDFIEPGGVVHYADADRLLRAAGFMANGKDARQTILAALERSPYWTRQGSRTGKYRRNAPHG